MTNDEIKKYRELFISCNRVCIDWSIIFTKELETGLSELECDALRDYLVAAYKGFPNALDEVERGQRKIRRLEDAIVNAEQEVEGLRARVMDLEARISTYEKVLEGNVECLAMLKNRFPVTADEVRWDGESMPWFINHEGRPEQAKQVVRTRDQWAIFQSDIKGVWTVIYFHESYSTQEAAEEAIK